MTVCAVCLYFLAKVSPGLSAFLIGGLFVIWSWVWSLRFRFLIVCFGDLLLSILAIFTSFSSLF
jgi:hypothetical protein